MPLVQYFTACTIDGLIADENNALDWLYETPHGEDDGRLVPTLTADTRVDKQVHRH